jgi:uncharacterized protein
MDTSPIYVDLKDLALRGGERFERTFNLELAPVVLGGQSYQVLAPRGVNVVVDRVAGGFLVRIALTAVLYGPCERCLSEAKIEVAAEQQEFVPSTEEEWDESDLSPFIEDMVADVGGLAREATVLAVPGQILCSPECRGLCPTCGKNLNAGPCSCPSGMGDERWSSLQNLTFEP